MKLTKHLGRGGAAGDAGAAVLSPTEITITAFDLPGGTVIPWTEFWVDGTLGNFGVYGPESGATVEEWRAYVIADGMPAAMAEFRIATFYSDAAAVGYSLQVNKAGITDTVTISVNGTPDPNISIDWGDSLSSNASDFTGSVISHTYSSISNNDTRGISVLGESEFLVDFEGALTLTSWGTTPWYSGEYLAKFVVSIDTFSETDTPTFKDTGVVKFGHSTMFNVYGASPDVTNWDVSNVTDFSDAFKGCETFNQDISGWNVSKGTSFSNMFLQCFVFNQDISGWNVSNGTDFSDMFRQCYVFNANIGSWDMSNATTLRAMFSSASVFNQPLNNWDVSNVTDLQATFASAKAFNQPLNLWNTSNVTNMYATFSSYPAAFNQDISSWDTSNVTRMTNMFSWNPVFNQPLNSWDVSSVQDFYGMFGGYSSSISSAFNQPLNLWNTSAATRMTNMFRRNAVFNQDIRMWDVTNVQDFTNMFSEATAMLEEQEADATPTPDYFEE